MFTILIDYPSAAEEVDIVKTTTSAYVFDLQKVIDAKKFLFFQDLIRRMPVADDVIGKVIHLVSLTRPGDKGAPENVRKYVAWGAGPRASQYLILGAKARAALDGRYAPNIGDVKSVAHPVLRHRIITNFAAEAEGVKSDDIVAELIGELD
jgi:MoxR-like ATPase